MNTPLFDAALRSLPSYEGYYGDPPVNEEQYNALVWTQEWDKPTWANMLVLMENVQKENCKKLAKEKLAASDWSVLPDVNISNKSDFESYRATLRGLIINPVIDPVWPTEPQPVWV